MNAREEIQRIIARVAETLGYSVYETGVFLKGENSRVIVKIDRDSGISHRDCERFSRELAAAIDAEDILPNYSLEVSSPGLNRRLRSPQEFARFVGAPVKVVIEGDGARTVVKGDIVSADERGVTIASDRGDRRVSYEDVTSATLDY